MSLQVWSMPGVHTAARAPALGTLLVVTAWGDWPLQPTVTAATNSATHFPRSLTLMSRATSSLSLAFRHVAAIGFNRR